MARRSRSLIGCWLALAWCSASGSWSRGDDAVYLHPAAGGGARVLNGEVVEYSARQLRLRVAGGRERTIPSEQVARVETGHCPEQTDGDELFAAGDLRAALAKYRSALDGDREPRGWVRQELVADIAWCQQLCDQWGPAGDTFLALLAAAPQTRFFECIPLPWPAAEPSAALVQKAHGWLSEKANPPARLLAAAHLLSTPDRSTALQALKQLVGDPDGRIAWLAQAQSWRAAAAERVPIADLERWSRQIEASDESLRAGAYFVLGTALKRQGQNDAAAIALLKLPILYPRQRALAATALLGAGHCLDRAGRKAQAEGLYRELLAGYRQAPEAEEALRRLESLPGPGQ